MQPFLTLLLYIPSGTSGATSFGALAAQASTSTSGQSGVKGASQEGIDRTSVDILQFAGGSASAGSSTPSAPTGFAALAQMAPTKRKLRLNYSWVIVGTCANAIGNT